MVTKTEMNVVVRNPEIVFVADLTRADAPALVMTTQCELVMKSGAEGSQMTAAIKDLKVCVFIPPFPPRPGSKAVFVLCPADEADLISLDCLKKSNNNQLLLL